MALISRGINWRKVLERASEDPMTLADALAKLSADMEDLDFRMEGGSNDLNQRLGVPSQDELERATQFLTPDLVTSFDETVTVTPDRTRGTADLSALPVLQSLVAGSNITLTTNQDDTVTVAASAAASFNSRPFMATLGGTSPTLTFAETLDPSGSFSAGTYTFAADGIFVAVASVFGSGSATDNTNGTSLEWQPTLIATLGGTAGFAEAQQQRVELRATLDGGAGELFTSGQDLSGLSVLCIEIRSVTAGQTLTVSAAGTCFVDSGGAVSGNMGFDGVFAGFYLST